ncbi:MAG: type II toxin-antitoxin system PemK/MazF family toxin [Firmicutes bacterium]|nr:type II toxin-antitoxin system PemK/MazF family toxin [Bacillota bacterium]
MEGFVRGNVVVIPFPFSDLTQAKRRPALVLSVLPGNDLILCQITSQNVRDMYAVTLLTEDFETGSLNRISNVRPNRLFTADSNIVLYKVGKLKKIKMDEVLKIVISLFH